MFGGEDLPEGLLACLLACSHAACLLGPVDAPCGPVCLSAGPPSRPPAIACRFVGKQGRDAGDCEAVQKAYSKGHELASHTLSHSDK